MRGVFLVGPPGAGKTTQGAMLAHTLGGTHRSMGELVRTARAAGARLPSPAATSAAARQATVELIRGSLHAPTPSLVLDGFPRSPGQLAWLGDVAPGGCTIIEIRVGVGTCIERMKGRGRAGEDMATIAFRHDVYARASAALHGAAAGQGLQVRQVDGELEAHEVAAQIRALTEALSPAAIAG